MKLKVQLSLCIASSTVLTIITLIFTTFFSLIFSPEKPVFRDLLSCHNLKLKIKLLFFFRNDTYLPLQTTVPEVFPGSSLTAPAMIDTELHMYSVS